MVSGLSVWNFKQENSDIKTNFATDHYTGEGEDQLCPCRADVDDDLNYHLVINTGLVPFPVAAQLIANGVQTCLATGGKKESKA